MTTTKPDRDISELVDSLRQLAPIRPLTYGESLHVARLQASRLREWTEADGPDINLIWLTEQTTIPVKFIASHKLNEDSGLTTDLISGRLEMYLNAGEIRSRQRFSLLHEFKHALDFYAAGTLHAKLGTGNSDTKARMVEWICNEFAGHVLMPTKLIKRLWFELQDLRTMANLFHVSVEAMSTRLDRLGILGDAMQKPRHYFRRPLPVA